MSWVIYPSSSESRKFFRGLEGFGRCVTESSPSDGDGSGVEGNELNTFLGRLEASFDAQLARAEEEAVTDLAFSLRQDRTLRQRIERKACEVWVGDSWEPVVAAGSDVLVVGEPIRILVPAQAACLRAGPGDGPAPAPSWLSLLRALARRGQVVELISRDGAQAQGRLAAAAPDHVLVEGKRGWSAFAAASIGRIRLVLEG